jgi:raffinose/stachyose/melibiose transport system permease protein
VTSESATAHLPGRRTVRGARPPARGRAFRGLVRVALVLLLVVEVYPLVWLFLQSFKTSEEFTSNPIWALPKGLYLHNWSEAWTTGHIQTYFRNSLLATLPALALIIVLGLAAAFGIEVMRWRGRNVVLFLFIIGILIPMQMVLLPMFTIYFHLHLIDSLWSLIIAYTAFGLPLAVFLLSSYFRAVPREILEAASLDGASIYQTFLRIAAPMVSNAVVTVAVVSFFFIWNDLLLSLTFISSESKKTIQPGLLDFTGQFGQIDWGATFAAISMTVLPTLILYLFLNQRVIRGLTAGGVKG